MTTALLQPMLLGMLAFAPPGPPSSVGFLSQRPLPPLTTRSIAEKLRLARDLAPAPRRDFRWVGTGLGAAGLGLAGGLVGAAYCGNSENGPRSCAGTTIGFALGGAAIGGLVGHGVGRLIRR